MKTNTDRAPKQTERGFWYLFVTQFQGAFSDNALKFLAIFMVGQMAMSVEGQDKLINVVAALFALPFIVFSMTGGFLADRFSKRSVTIGVKVLEVFVMVLAFVGLATGNVYGGF